MAANGQLNGTGNAAAIMQDGLDNEATNAQVNGTGNKAGTVQLGARNLATNGQLNGTGNIAGIAQAGLDNEAANAQTGGSANNAAIVQTGGDNLATNVQTGVTDSNGLIAQFGTGNTAGNLQHAGSSNVDAAVLQVGNGNLASNTQGAIVQETINVQLPNEVFGNGKQRWVYDPATVTVSGDAPVSDSSAAVVQVGNGNTAANAQAGSAKAGVPAKIDTLKQKQKYANGTWSRCGPKTPANNQPVPSDLQSADVSIAATASNAIIGQFGNNNVASNQPDRDLGH